VVLSPTELRPALGESFAFPEGTDLVETLEFYFQCCSVELDTQSLAVVAATFANAGINPLTNDVFKPSTVRHCLLIPAGRRTSRDHRDYAAAICGEPGRPGRTAGALATGCKPNAADYDGRTALHLAAAEGYPAVVRFLLGSGARPEATDRWAGTPLTDARRAKHTAVADALWSHDSGDEPASGVLTDLCLITART